jgi:hypothetical protein
MSRPESRQAAVPPATTNRALYDELRPRPLQRTPPPLPQPPLHERQEISPPVAGLDSSEYVVLEPLRQDAPSAGDAES